MGVLRTLRRIFLVAIGLAVVAAIVAAGWLLTHRDEARAWRQVIVVAGDLSDLGALDRIAEVASTDTRPAREAQAGTLPATIVTPDDGERRHPAMVFFVPEGTSGDEERRVREAQHAFGAAGFSAWAVRVPTADDALVEPAVFDAVAGALSSVASDPSTESKAVSVVATGTTASLVLVAAPSIADQADVRAVVAVQPIADVKGIVSLAATGRYLDTTGQERTAQADEELRASAGRTVLRAVRSELEVQGAVVERLLDAAERSDDPLGAMRLVPDQVAGPQLRPLLDVLRAESLQEFDAAWDQLPERFREVALERSPLVVADRIRARVAVVEASSDPWARADARRLADALPNARFLRLDAEDPGAVLDDPTAIRDLLSISEWWMRAAGAP